MLLRATRLWAMSPTRPTVSPSTRPLIRRMVKMSSRPCVGCSWAPSPALMTLQCRCWASRCGAPGDGVAHHHHVDAHRLDVLGRVDERLALADAGAARREVDGVGAEALGGEAEAGPRARGRLEEEVDDDLALEVGCASCGGAGRPRRTPRRCRGWSRSRPGSGLPGRAGGGASRRRGFGSRVASSTVTASFLQDGQRARILSPGRDRTGSRAMRKNTRHGVEWTWISRARQNGIRKAGRQERKKRHFFRSCLPAFVMVFVQLHHFAQWLRLDEVLRPAGRVVDGRGGSG